MTDHNFNQKSEELQQRLQALGNQLPSCAPRPKNAPKAVHGRRIHLIRRGETLPPTLKVIAESQNTLVCHRSRVSDALNDIKIDVMNNGYNALLDYQSTVNRGWNETDSVSGRPALIVSTNYAGDTSTKIASCIPTLPNLIYSQRLVPGEQKSTDISPVFWFGIMVIVMLAIICAT